MLLGRENNPGTRRYSDDFDSQYREDIAYTAQLIEKYQYEEAWTLLNSLEKESIPLLFNKAICLYDARQNETILRLLDRAWTLLGLLNNGGMKPAGSPELTAIRDVQKSLLTYLTPITFRYIESFPHLLKDSILRLMVDIHLELDNKAKVIELATPLLSKGYRNIIEAIEKVKQ